jgi:hypothetical protein
MSSLGNIANLLDDIFLVELTGAVEEIANVVLSIESAMMLMVAEVEAPLWS